VYDKMKSNLEIQESRYKLNKIKIKDQRKKKI